MAEVSTTDPERTGDPPAASSWAVGWTLCAVVLMLLHGTMWIVGGLVALLGPEHFGTVQDGFRLDLRTWGWIHLIIGPLVLLGGIELFRGAAYGRVLGVILAAVGMVAGFAWLPWYTFASLLFIAMSGAILWALTTQGPDPVRAVR